ncbi:hypothetical protein [Clostridium botulinum]|uniref:hypothetical protein n=1 Tax=Clostridium botulinum TaxID=1491 RepID=UPI001C9B0A2A|nr:hypothetical protein [Clostridium botulinum]MBY6878489.1 hypothetical protein [Clostridium botulinum]
MDKRNLKDLIEYLQSIDEQLINSEDIEVRIDGQLIDDFEDYIELNDVEGYIDFITPSLNI